jgi:hypothetical protein
MVDILQYAFFTFLKRGNHILKKRPTERDPFRVRNHAQGRKQARNNVGRYVLCSLGSKGSVIAFQKL